MFVEKQAAEVAEVDVQQGASSEPVYYSTTVSITFEDTNPIATNRAIQDVLSNVPEGGVVKENGFTSFAVKNESLGHFLHLVYCHVPDGKVMNAAYDGISPYRAKDEDGVEHAFAMQLITVSEEPA